MKVFRHWQVERGTVGEGKHAFVAACYGGSNVSEEDARARAREKLERLRRKLAGEGRAPEGYEVEIREEILRVIDERAVITRTRYGAQVLNAADLMIMDIDRPPFAFADLFRRRDVALDKQRILALVRRVSATAACRGCGFRVYETSRGIRVLVLGRTFDPTADETCALMSAFHTDGLYARLCRRQGCFRARLTPKPGRMKVASHKVRFPREAAEEAELRAWLAEYEMASRSYSVCRLVELIGPGEVSEVVRVHDEVSVVDGGRTLA